MLKKEEIIRVIYNRADVIKSHKDIELVIQKHHQLMLKLYLTKPLYFKVLFKAHRFVIASVIMASFFTTKNPTLSGVKDFCKDADLISSNTIDSFLLFTRVTRRIVVQKDSQDKRKLSYVVTSKALNEAKALINTMLIPYSMLYKDFDVSNLLEMDVENFNSEYFKKYSEITLNHIYLFDMVQDCKPFVFRDAGHMILIDLYVESIRQQTTVIEYNYLKASLKYGVSRSHIKRCFVAAEDHDLLRVDSSSNTVVLHQAFTKMVRSYFSVYMAMMEYGLRIFDR